MTLRILIRSSTGVSDFHYSEVVAKQTNVALDPTRIRNKPFGALESRDSAEHPNSNAVFVCGSVRYFARRFIRFGSFFWASTAL